MTDEDKMQQNIRRSTGQHALNKIRAIVEQENNNDAYSARALVYLFRYGWIVVLLAAAIVAYWMGGRSWLGF